MGWKVIFLTRCEVSGIGGAVWSFSEFGSNGYKESGSLSKTFYPLWYGARKYIRRYV